MTIFREHYYIDLIYFSYLIILAILFTLLLWVVFKQYDAINARSSRRYLLQIAVLNRVVKKQSHQLSTMREILARDFHDETGNTLSAIMRQAEVLKLWDGDDENVKLLAANIISSTEQLYATSRDFLWCINHNSDDPVALFAYITDFGDRFYTQFDVTFYSHAVMPQQATLYKKIRPFVARHVISIFKEAMTNTAKHSGANKVVFTMHVFPDILQLVLKDNGCWKSANKHPPDSGNGIVNMKRRSVENGMTFNLFCGSSGTQIQLDIPIF